MSFQDKNSYAVVILKPLVGETQPCFTERNQQNSPPRFLFLFLFFCIFILLFLFFYLKPIKLIIWARTSGQEWKLPGQFNSFKDALQHPSIFY